MPVAELLERPGARPAAALLVALRLLPARPRRDDGHGAAALARRRPGARPEVRERGFTALKTNIFCFDQGAPYMHQPGFARNDGWPELNVDQRLLGIIERQMAAFREGAGPAVDLLLDLNFNFKTEGYLEVAKAIAPYRLMWLEIDSYDPKALALIRQQARHPDRVLRIAVRPPPVPPVPRRPGGRRRDRRRALERHPRGHQDRGDGRVPTRSTARRTISTATCRR